MRHLARRLLGAVALTGALAGSGVAAAEPPARVIVTLKSGATLLREQPMSAGRSATQAADAGRQRAAVLASVAGVPLEAGPAVSERTMVMFGRGIDAASLARRLAANAQVERVVVDHRRRALLVPDDPLFAAGPASGRGPDVGQWYLRAPAGDVRSAINAQAAWDRVTGSPSIVVAVLDTGVRFDHVDLSGALLPGYDMISDVATANDGNGRDADASDPGDWVSAADINARGSAFTPECLQPDSSWHGTQTAGLIGAVANNGLGMAGAAFGVQILPVRVLGKCGGYDSDIQAGMRWAAGLDVPGVPRNTHPARILNMSLGGAGTCTESTGYPAVIRELLAAGTAVVVAAGNSNGHATELPANCAGVIAVGGLRHAGSKVGYSDLGPEIAISAPAGNCVNTGSTDPCLYPILTTTNTGTQQPNAGGSTWTDSYDYSAGTSFSAPLVAGSAALMLSARPQLTPDELKRLMQGAARPFPTDGAGLGENGLPVPMCHAPDGTDQIQCYCSAGLCGAGMLDAAASVQAALGAVARIAVDPALPQVGDTIRLSAAGSLPAVGAILTGQSWALVANPGVVSGIQGATDAVEVTLSAAAAGTFSVKLVVNDDQGHASTLQRDITVAAVAPPASGGSSDGGGGGGAVSPLWNGLLALGVAALLHARRRPSGESGEGRRR